jgi:hypothetical protein
MNNHDMKTMTETDTTWRVHAPGLSSGDVAARGRTALEAVRGLKVGYWVGGCGYNALFEPLSSRFREEILGGKGGWEVLGKAGGRAVSVWVHRPGK